MTDVIGVRFKQAGQMSYFSAPGIDVNVGDSVIVDTGWAAALGKVIITSTHDPTGGPPEPLKPITRKAGPDDFRRLAEFRAKEPDALVRSAELAAKHNLPIKIIAAEYSFDGRHLTLYFRAESKVDFRALLRDLNEHLGTRVELRQTGARDEAKLLGGLGRCGRALCCTSHLCKFDPISVRMARDQDLPLNPNKISGVCGKLLCCLSYEHEQYRAAKAVLPAVGKTVTTPRGPATVVQISPLKETVRVRLENEAALEFPISEIQPSNDGEQPKT